MVELYDSYDGFVEVHFIRLLGKELAKHVLPCGYMHIMRWSAVILLNI